jgi:hypothetical protein
MPDDTTTADTAGPTDDTTAATATTATTSAADSTTTSPDEDAVAQADKPDAVKNAIRRHQEDARKERKRAEAAETKAKEFEDRDKTAQEKADAKAVEAEAKATKAEAKLLRIEVADEKELPVSLASRLQGDTKEELEADAEKLRKELQPANATDFDGGPRPGAPQVEDMDSMIRRAAGRG